MTDTPRTPEDSLEYEIRRILDAAADYLVSEVRGRGNTPAPRPDDMPRIEQGDRWRIRFVCCGRDDGEAIRVTRDEAEALRNSYVAVEGHVRSAIVDRIEEMTDTDYHVKHDDWSCECGAAWPGPKATQPR